MKNVVSLFDGMGIGLLTLMDLGFQNFTYYRSEIDPKANKAFYHFFTKEMLNSSGIDVVECGDVRNFPRLTAHGLRADWTTIPEELLVLGKEKIDLLLAGSPCTNLSFCGKQEGLVEGTESSLFYEFIRIKNDFQPTHFLLENTPMKKEFLNEITKEIAKTIFPEDEWEIIE